MLVPLSAKSERARYEKLLDLVARKQSVDVALIVDTYHHIGGREAYFRTLAKSLKPGGRVAIVDFRPDAPEGPPPEFRFSPEQLKSEIHLHCLCVARKAGK